MRRTIGAIAAGYVVITGLTALTFIILNTLYAGQLDSSFWLIFKLVLAMVCALVGGYITATVARSMILTHVWWLAGLFTGLAAISMLQTFISEPMWFQLGLLFLSGPMIMLGGVARVWQNRRTDSPQTN